MPLLLLYFLEWNTEYDDDEAVLSSSSSSKFLHRQRVKENSVHSTLNILLLLCKVMGAIIIVMIIMMLLYCLPFSLILFFMMMIKSVQVKSSHHPHPVLRRHTILLHTFPSTCLQSKNTSFTIKTLACYCHIVMSCYFHRYHHQHLKRNNITSSQKICRTSSSNRCLFSVGRSNIHTFLTLSFIQLSTIPSLFPPLLT